MAFDAAPKIGGVLPVIKHIPGHGRATLDSHAALPVVDAPFFPEGTVLVTFLKNLSIYWQEGARRRNVIDNPKRDRVENYESSNDAYVIEDYDGIALIENIEIVEEVA